MKVYFTASLRGTQYYEHYYRQIYNEISSLGHIHMDDQLFTLDRSTFYAEQQSIGQKAHEVLQQRKTEAIQSADICIFETSLDSSSIGYQIAKSLYWHKPTLILHLKENSPFFLSGIHEEKLVVRSYTAETLKVTLRDGIDYVNQKKDQRFNFFISPDLLNYLDSISKRKGMTKSVYLRSLIESDKSQAK